MRKKSAMSRKWLLIPAAILLVAAITLLTVTLQGRGADRQPVTVALLHMRPEHGQKEANMEKIRNYAAEAFEHGAKIVITPEMATDAYFLTKEEVVSYAGIKDIDKELSSIADTAKKYAGYICIGFPEIAQDGTLYNSAVLFDKNGKIALHERKTAIPSWNRAGDLPAAVADTEYGKLGIVICADGYSPDKAAALGKLGVDIILSPVTWYTIDDGAHKDDENITSWKARAKENSAWYAVCNRWGVEINDGTVHDMNEGPSVLVSPEGEIILEYRAGDNRQDRILYGEI